MAFGLVTNEMNTILGELVKDKVVYDFGAGDFERSLMLAHLGAAKVVAIEKEYQRQYGVTNVMVQGNLTKIGDRICNLPVPESIDVSCLFWPINSTSMNDVLPCLRVSEIIIYLGANDSYTACGSKELGAYLSTLKVLYVVSHRANDLIVYKNEPRVNQPHPKSEFEALCMWNPSWKM